MKNALAVLGCIFACASVASAADSVLFIGNSFTYGQGSPVRFYRSAAVTDLNGDGVGGVPSLFEVFARQAGLDYDVALETRGGTGLDWHLANKSDVIGGRAWDVVVAHGYSTLDADKPRDPAKLVATSEALAALVRRANPRVALYLTATWARADQVYTDGGAWMGAPIEKMAEDVRRAYDQAAAVAGAQVSPVGDAWNRAMRIGLADSNPYDGLGPGQIDLWTFDHYHASTAGYYLEALVVFGRVTGIDPVSLAERECAAFELGLSADTARRLQEVARDELLRAGVALRPVEGASTQGPPRRCAAP
jgi:hypothetical protein